MRPLFLPFLSLLILFGAACSPAPVHDQAADEAALRALDSAYTQAWKLSGTDAQQAAVMPLLLNDALLMPGRGTDPRRGEAAIRDFWFPANAPAANTTVFVHDPHDISVYGDVGMISGRYVLKMQYDGADFAQEGNYLTVAERQDGGSWLISKMIWNDRDSEN